MSRCETARRPHKTWLTEARKTGSSAGEIFQSECKKGALPLRRKLEGVKGIVGSSTRGISNFAFRLKFGA